MSKTFLIVKKYIDQLDYYALLAGGAPSDEFDIESRIISEKISFDNSAEVIADIIASVFNRSFDEENNVPAFLSIAQQIKNELLD